MHTLCSKAQDQRGLGLVETLIALVVMGTSLVAFLSGLSAGSIAVREQDKIAVSQELAQTQLEYTKNYAYNPAATTYPAVTAPPGYSITVSVTTVPTTDTNIQKITVTVTRDSVTLVTVSGYKMNR